ncbi:SGNH/GDSL hydrolase family protein [Aquabacterium sp.]|uniref:SGNH/GDSL hydrolase family protein n=1 Tax=Aquabacterium sp. TaxID=1872578 RepID=UPI0025BBE728|nr:SGNH/GDSL hydrolase family protein [Aquabacterium sp.]
MFPVAASRLPVNRRRLGWVALACSAAGLAMGLSACGGGSRNSFFAPGSIVSFGDENSAFDTYAGSLKKADGTTGSGAMIKGLTYTVHDASVGASVVCADPRVGTPSALAVECTAANANGATLTSPTLDGYYGFSFFTSAKLEVESPNQLTTTTAYNCGTPRIWVHVLARNYGRGYNSQCAIDPYSGAVSYAAFGAKTDDVIAQIAAHRGELNGSTLVTIMVGQNDILEQFNAIRATPATTDEATAIATLQARADRMAAAVKDVIGTGAKVALALTPSLNDSPRGLATDAALMSRLVVAYNDRLYVRGLGNVSGRDLVGVNPDSFTNSTTRSTSYVHGAALCNTTGLVKPDGSVTTGSEPDADANVRFCNTSITLNGSTSTYIWADATHYAPLGHALIGSLAYNRARQQL